MGISFIGTQSLDTRRRSGAQSLDIGRRDFLDMARMEDAQGLGAQGLDAQGRSRIGGHSRIGGVPSHVAVKCISRDGRFEETLVISLAHSSWTVGDLLKSVRECVRIVPQHDVQYLELQGGGRFDIEALCINVLKDRDVLCISSGLCGQRPKKKVRPPPPRGSVGSMAKHLLKKTTKKELAARWAQTITPTSPTAPKSSTSYRATSLSRTTDKGVG